MNKNARGAFAAVPMRRTLSTIPAIARRLAVCVTAALCLVLLVTAPAARAALLNPADYTSLSMYSTLIYDTTTSLDVSDPYYTGGISVVIDTDAGTLDVYDDNYVFGFGAPVRMMTSMLWDPTATRFVDAAGTFGVAVFTFDSITIGSGVTVSVSGSRALALLSKGAFTMDGDLSVTTSDTRGGPGGWPGSIDHNANFGYGWGPGGGNRQTSYGGGGGAFGGEGGVNDPYHYSYVGAQPYGNLATALVGGSGGSMEDGVSGGYGGGGGGAVELGALGSLNLSGVIDVGGGYGYQVNNDPYGENNGGGGGSGGGILLHAPSGLVNGALYAWGGSGGSCIKAYNSYGSGGAGGGGGRIMFAGGVSVNGASPNVAGGPGGLNATTHINFPGPAYRGSAGSPGVISYLTTIGLTSSQSPAATFGQPVTLRATLTGAVDWFFRPTGTVTFKDGAATLGTGTLAVDRGPLGIDFNGPNVATFTTSALSVGSHAVTAEYAGGSMGVVTGNYERSTSAPLTQIVNKAGTTTTIATGLNPSVHGQSATFTATVSTGVATAATGTVNFYEGAALLGSGTLASGTATFATTGLSAGTHTITATYAGDGNFVGSTSAGAVSQTVNKAASTTSVALTTGANPSIYGQPVSFTATASSGATGTVIFTDGATTLCGGPLTLNGSAQASCSTSLLIGGPHTITATYGGDGHYSGSSGTTSHSVNRAASATSVALSAGTDPSVYEQSVTFTATATAGTTGTVTFTDGAAVMCGGPVALNGSFQASCSVSSLVGGAHTITAAYGGDGNFNVSSGTVAHGVDRADSSTALSSDANPSTYLGAVNFAAAFAGGETGTVAFVDGATTLCAAVPISAGVAACMTSTLGGGDHTITATYSGDGNYNGSAGAMVQTVNRRAQEIAVLPSAPGSAGYLTTFEVGATSTSGLAVTIAASGACSGGGTGTATVSMAGGSATCSVSYYQAGDANFLPAPPVAQSTALQGADLSLKIDDTPDPVGSGGTVQLIFAVTNHGPSAKLSGVNLFPLLPRQLESSHYSADGGLTWLPLSGGIAVPELTLGVPCAILIEGTVTQEFVGSLATAGILLSPVADDNRFNESEMETTAVEPQADVSVAAADAPDPGVLGQDVTYSFGYHNDGPTTAAAAKIEFQTAADAVLQSSSVDCVDAGGGRYTLSLGAVAAAGNAPATLVVRYTSAGIKSWSATASSPAVDLDPADNAASGDTTLAGLLLTVTAPPAGSGRVTGTGIDCPGDCTETIDTFGQIVELTASPSAGFEFVRWSGAATGTAAVAIVKMDEAGEVTAQFNGTPTQLLLSASTVAEHLPAGAAVGTFSTVDPDGSSVFAYTLVDGDGGVDNASFRIEGDALVTDARFNFKEKNSLSIRVRSADQGLLSVERTFAIAVRDLLEAKNDFDGDGRSDIGCYDPAGGNWYGFDSTAGFWQSQFGYEWTIPVAGDYDGDGTSDLGVYEPVSGTWYLMMSTAGFRQTQFGYAGTIPVVGDFDGDGRDDIGVYYPPEGNWYVMKSTAGFWQTQFGYAGTIPVVGDYDGDGTSDIGIYFAPLGDWQVFGSTAGYWQTQFGYDGTIPVVGDFDGDGRSDIGCYYPPGGSWAVYKSTDGFWQSVFGYVGTEPVVGDYDGDGTSDIGCYYPAGGTWYLFKSAEGFWQTQFGYEGTIPLGGTLR